MRKLFMVMALALTLSLGNTAQAQRHRHNPAIVNVSVNDKSTAITAYSDTTTAADNDDNDSTYTATNADEDKETMDFTSADDPLKLMAYLTTLGVGGVIALIFFVLLCIVTVASPFVFVALIIYWVMHRKKTEYKIIEKAVENGQPIPQNLTKNNIDDKERVWQQGIKYIAIGAGLVLFGLLITKVLIAGGLLIACIGVGKCVIARTSARGSRNEVFDESYDDIKEEQK